MKKKTIKNGRLLKSKILKSGQIKLKGGDPVINGTVSTNVKGGMLNLNN